LAVVLGGIAVSGGLLLLSKKDVLNFNFQGLQDQFHQEKTGASKQSSPPPVVLTEKQKAAAADAIKALGRIEAAVEVGVNHQQYGQLVIDAKAVVNEAERTLPSGELLTALTETIDAYRDAGTVWSHKIRFDHLGLSKEFGHGELIAR